MNKYRYFMPVEIVFGRGCRSKLVSHPLIQRSEKSLLIAGGHLKKDGTIGKLLGQFSNKSLVYEPKISKSDIKTIDALTRFCRKEKPDLVIAIGGGTILDTAKSAAILAKNFGSIKDYVISKEKTIDSPGIPVIAVPTTAGTGSEVTPWATAWDMQDKKKYSLSTPLMFPKMALVDSELTDNLPSKITAYTGMDALAQAIEAYWSKNHNPVSDIFALEAIRLIISNLERAVNNPDKKSREMVSRGSLLAGLAFSNTATTICHSVSYPITAHFGIPHGHAVALTLASFLEYSFKAIGSERSGLLLDAIGEPVVDRAATKIKKLMEKIGLETKLSRLGIKENDIQLIADESFHPERTNRAPKIPTEEELKNILVEIF